MNIQEFKEKYSVEDIKNWISELDYIADHEDSEFYRDLYWMMVELFPDCDPYESE